MRKKKAEVVGNGVSRRDFVAGLTTSAVALSGVALLGGCSGSGGASPSTQNWDREADVVVVGFGGAGAAAAIEAAKAGAKVLVLEKTQAGGGSTLINGGIMYMGGGTALQKKLGIEDTRDDMFKYMVAAAGPGANEELIGLYCDSSVAFYDWCVSIGMQFPEEFAPGKYVVTPEGTGLQYSGNERNAEYAAIAKPAARGHTPGTSGAGIFSPLAKTIENSEAEVVYNAEGKSLITDDSGRVIGLQATIDGKTVSVKANRGVVLTTGGWALDKNMVAAYCPECLDAAVMIAVPTDLGTGIKMGQEVGADLRGMNKLSYSIPLYAYGDAITSGILVNRYGRRMLAEDCYASWTGLAVLRQGRKGWAIVDSKVAGSIRDPFGDKTKEPFATGNSIPELAAALEINPSVLSNTVDLYNAGVAKGVDEEFQKGSHYLATIDEPPFAAYDMGTNSASYFLPLGGLKIDQNASVLSAATGAPIAGLYSAGRNACAIFGDYMGSGTSVVETLIFGRIAGQQAAAAEPSE